MPRMSQKRKIEEGFFLGDCNRANYCERCRRCARECKQSHKVVVVICPKYISSRAGR